MCATLVQLEAVLAIKPTLTVGEARGIFDYVPDSDNLVDAWRKSGLPE